MAIDFPSNPTNGQTITVGDITYAYDSTKGVWTDNPQGLTQALDALTDVDTSTAAPTNGQVLVYDSASSKFKPGDMSAGVTVYATIDDLPLSGVAEGEMALVDSTDRLYIFSDLGWYNIALVNTSPSISNVASSYTLSTDGSATVITIDAADPEGLPLTFSLVSDTSANTATVVQGTGANTNIFTVTPSTNNADAGAFSLTFRASDGVNIASATSSFTLLFSIANSKYTTALITSVGTNLADNNDFVDSSTNSHTITPAGNATQTTFSPYRHNGYSTYFDGTGDHLSIADNAAFNFGSGDSTIEMWVYPLGTGTFNLITRGSSGYSGFILSSTGFLESTNGSSWAVNMTFSTAITANSWQHVAVVRNGSTITVYRNGVSIGTSSISGSVVSAAQSLTIGQRAGQSNFSGYMTDLRIVKGTPITPLAGGPTERLTAVTNTSLLACHLPYIADGSTTGHTITVNGDTKTEPFVPYDYALSYDSDSNGASMYFDGAGDYLTVPSSSAFTLDGDFTIEGWFYSDGAQVVNYPSIISSRSFSATSFSVRYNHTGYNNKFFVAKYGINGSGGANSLFVGTISVPYNTWNHFALVRSGSQCSLYVNGALDTTNTDSTDFDLNQGSQGTAIGGGNWDGVASALKGNISNLRVVKGTAVYTGEFSPPNGPLTTTGGSYPSTTNVNTSITAGNTSLLLKGTNAGIIDKSQSVKTITLNGDVKSSTTQTKYLSSSMYFDGTGDYLQMDNQNVGDFGTLDFTAEGWIYLLDNSALYTVVDGRPSNLTSASGWSVAVSTSGELYVYSGGFLITGAASAVTPNNWHHWAYTRESGTHKLFLNGTQTGSSSTDARDLTAQLFRIGASGTGGEVFKGYQSDVRITKGLARYTAADESANIPTAALQG